MSLFYQHLITFLKFVQLLAILILGEKILIIEWLIFFWMILKKNIINIFQKINLKKKIQKLSDVLRLNVKK